MENSNKLTTLPLKQLVAWEENPRKIFDDVYISELAQSIKANGVFDNLIVMPKEGKKNKYEIISGECRFRAMKQLVKDGDIPKDYDVPVSIREGLEAQEAMRLAVLVNIQRKDMHPMDEAHAVAGLVHDGVTLPEISAQTGLSVSTIRKRIALTSLCGEVQDALRKGEITLSVGQALTMGTHDRQKELLEDGLENESYDDVFDRITCDQIPLSTAIFDINQYTGNITRDLFFSEDDSFFDDTEQFMELQKQAVEKLVAEKEEAGFSPVEVCKDRWFYRHEYRQAEEGEKGGCVIHFSPDGDVSVHDGLISREIDKETVDAIKEEKPKATYSNPLCEYIGMQKTIAVQDALLSNPRKAKEVAVVMMIHSKQVHSCYRYFTKIGELPKALEAINTHAYSLLNATGFDLEDIEGAVESLEKPKYDLAPTLYDYEAVKQLSDEELDQLHLLLTTVYFGQSHFGLDTNENSFFNLVANDLEVDMRDYWTPDNFFLSRLKIDKLDGIISETETSHLFGTIGGYKKKDIVSMLAKHFGKLSSQDICEEKDLKAKNWLPEVFNFPAVDPDKTSNDDLIEEVELVDVA
ncbi:ParB/RepB/Spo0J family partition protein [Porticoccus sp. GXU_MW_L64]